MKRTITITILLVLIYKTVSSQAYDEDNTYQFNEIINLLKEKEYHEAIIKMDYFLQLYPTNAPMYFNRGLAKLYLNDYSSAKKDLLEAKKFRVQNRDKIINRYTSKSYMVKLLTEPYFKNVQLDSARGFKPVFTLKDSLRGALRPERTCFDVYFYNLTVKVLPKTKSIEGNNQIYFKTLSKTKKIQIDLAESLQVNSISWKGKELKYNRTQDAIFIDFDEELPADENQIITIVYSGSPRIAPLPPWDGGFAWKKKRGKLWIGVACEHLGSSSWWPGKDHLSDKPDSMTINIQAPKGYQAIANGNLRSKKMIDEKYTNFEWHVNYPINSYNVTFYIGNFVNFNETYTNQDGSYPIDYYVLPHNLYKAKKFYNQTKDIVKVYEKIFGEYPYKKDGMAMVEAPFAGMEHQSAIAIGDKYEDKKRDFYENKDFDHILVHELAHEWWGNTVAMGDMADAWISEAFATYAEHLFMEEKFGYGEYINATATVMRRIFNIWPIVGIRDVNDNTFPGGDIYHKGAAMLNNLRCTINNDSLFFAIVKGFYNSYKYKIATTTDFIDLVNRYTGNDYTDFFNKFLYETEPPILKYKFIHNNNKLTFTYEWSNVGSNFIMPFSIAINNDQYIKLIGTTKQQTFETDNVKTFFLPNEGRFDKDKIISNSFTYYWTSWDR